MSSKDDPQGCGARPQRDSIRRVMHTVASSGNTEARRPGERRFGPGDRRLAARAEPSDRRRGERRDS